MTDILSKIFGSGERVKIMRLFILNPETVFTVKDVLERGKINPRIGKRELSLLKEVSFLKQKTIHIEGSRRRRKPVIAFFLNNTFSFLSPLKLLLFNAEIFKKEEVVGRLKGGGRIKVIITAGVFINDDNSRADLLIVGDELRKNVIERAIKSMEAEIGRELVYGVFETEDFRYRVSVCDKFVRDVLDYPHKKILNKLEDAF